MGARGAHGAQSMSGFKRTNDSGVLVHSGDPSCDSAHEALLSALKKMGTAFIGTGETISHSQTGNLGEFISLHIGRNGSFANHQRFAHNAIQPLTRISGAGIDLMYVYLDPNDENNDLLYIQEIKTTGQQSLNYFNALEKDYKKLFSTNLNLTLQSRINFLANSFEIERDNEDHARRVQKLGARRPELCTNVRLVPTGLHEAGVGDPVKKMLAVRTAIAAFGWQPSAISPWTIGLTDLEDRLLRLARGEP